MIAAICRAAIAPACRRPAAPSAPSSLHGSSRPSMKSGFKRRHAERARILADQQVQHRRVAGDRAPGNPRRLPARPLAGPAPTAARSFLHHRRLHLARAPPGRCRPSIRVSTLSPKRIWSLKPPARRQQFAGLQVDQQHHHRGGSDVDRESGVPPSRLRLKQRLVGRWNIDPEGLADLRAVLHPRTRRNRDHQLAGKPGLAGPNRGRRADQLAANRHTPVDQLHLAAPAQAAPATTRVQRQPWPREYRLDRAPRSGPSTSKPARPATRILDFDPCS